MTPRPFRLPSNFYKLRSLYTPIIDRGMTRNPLLEIVGEVKQQGPDWRPFREGLFGRDFGNLVEVADE
jgi:hypothetical protein